MFSTNDDRMLRCPSLYSISVNPKFPAPGNTIVHASQISKLFI
jgi:hypothetical protein